MKCKVAIIPELNKPFQIEECEIAELKPGEVRVKIMTCAICHSDIHSVKGEHGVFAGAATAGHEIAGIVDAIGEGVTYVKPGDRVMACIVRQGCGKCPNCLAGHSWHCTGIKPSAFEQPSAYTRADGTVPTQTGATATGFAEYTNCDESCLCKMDDDIPFDVGSALACGFISGFGAVINRCKVRPGESLVCFGTGGVGLSAIQGARVSGANPIIAIDGFDEKLELAKKMGATHTLNYKNCDVVAEIKKITGVGAEHAIVAVAGAACKRQALQAIAPWGQVCVIGHATRDQEMMNDVCFMDFLLGKRLTGSVMGAVNLRADMPKYMDMYRHGIIDVKGMLTRYYPLEKVNEAFDDAEHSGALKDVVVIGAIDEYKDLLVK